ncbi:MAG: septum site-determining protein MinC [Gammaproteobacteria bacterium]
MTQSTTAFQLKGSLFTFTILQLLQDGFEAIEQQLVKLAKQTPAFFKHTPIIIDLQKLTNQQTPIDWQGLQQLLRRQGLIPVGVLNATSDQAETAQTAGLALLTQNRGDDQEKPQPQQTPVSKLITQPVRSGQQIYARKSDLIVLASVSPGAELMADGNIHVYGALRGRALAGVMGDTNARIFCQKLEAELISIAGYYKLKEESDLTTEPCPVQIYLENQHVKIAKI